MAIVQVEGKSGVLRDTVTGDLYVQKEVREDDFYDTIELASGTISTGDNEVFMNISNKNAQHQNMSANRKIPSDNEINISRIGVHVRQTFGTTVMTASDLLRIYDNMVLTFKLDERLITRGPLLKYQSGLGVVVFSTENAFSNATLGVPSAAAAPRLERMQTATDRNALNAQVSLYAAGWLTSYTAPSLTNRNTVSVFAHGIVSKPLGT